MITKRIFQEKLRRRLSGGDVSSSIDVDPRDIYLEMESCYCATVEKALNLYGEDIQGEFITVYKNVPIMCDTDRDRYYSTLPAQLISVRSTRNISGLRQISPMKSEYAAFIPMKSGDATTFFGLEASGLGGQIGFWLEGTTIIYENMPKIWDGKGVLVKMISSIYSLNEDDFIPIPAALEKEYEEMVYATMKEMKMKVNDKIENSVDNKLG